MQGKEHKIKTLETLHAHSLLCELEYNTSVGFFTPMQNKLKWFEGDTYGSLSIKESHFLNPHTCWVVCLSQWSDSNWELNSQGLPDVTMDNSWIPWRVRCKASVLHWLGKDTSCISFLPVEPFSHRGLLSSLRIFTLTSLSQRTGSDKVAAWISSLRNGEGSCSAGWMETSLKAWPEIVGDRKKNQPVKSSSICSLCCVSEVGGLWGFETCSMKCTPKPVKVGFFLCLPQYIYSHFPFYLSLLDIYLKLDALNSFKPT